MARGIVDPTIGGQHFRLSIETAVKPVDTVPHLEARQPYRHPHQVLSPRTRHSQDVPARLEDPVDLPPELWARHPGVPRAAHEALLLRPVLLPREPGRQASHHVFRPVLGEAVGRIGDAGMNAAVGELLQDLQAVATGHGEGRHGAPMEGLAAPLGLPL